MSAHRGLSPELTCWEVRQLLGTLELLPNLLYLMLKGVGKRARPSLIQHLSYLQVAELGRKASKGLFPLALVDIQ